MTIHVTPIPSTIDFVAPAFILATSNIAGSATTAIASDSTLLTFDTTVPTDISTGAESAATGSVALPSRRDHVHGSAATVFQAGASEVEMEAASSTTVVVTPGRTQNHPGVAKVYGTSEANGTLASGPYNVSGVASSATGIYTWTWITDFANTDYSLQVTLQATVLNVGHTIHDSYAVGTARILIRDDGGSLANEAHHVVGFGLQ
jgi:hypothetical protein